MASPAMITQLAATYCVKLHSLSMLGSLVQVIAPLLGCCSCLSPYVFIIVDALLSFSVMEIIF